jgi:hypothetical protein
VQGGSVERLTLRSMEGDAVAGSKRKLSPCDLDGASQVESKSNAGHYVALVEVVDWSDDDDVI